LLLGSIFSLLLSNSLVFRRDISILYSRIGIIILFFCIYLAYNSLFIAYIDNGIGIFGGLFFISSITQSFHILIFFLSLLILNMTGFYPRKLVHSKYLGFFNLFFSRLEFIKKLTVSNIILKNGEQYSIIEYTLVLLFVIMGSILLISSSDLISIFLAIELQSYGLYLLCAIYRNSESSTSSSLTYFLLGALASCFILLGIAVIYTNLGITYLDHFYLINNLSSIVDLDMGKFNNYTVFIPYSILLITVGLLFKISAAPFHF
jgi:NADH-ubiquinone oxidoreductase chain 2